MGPRELLAAVEIAQAEGRDPRCVRKIRVLEGEDFLELEHIGDKTAILIKGNIATLYWRTKRYLPKIYIKTKEFVLYTKGNSIYIQLPIALSIRALL